MGILDILNQLTGKDDDHDRFDQVAKNAPRDQLGDGIAEAFKSDKTPDFGQMVGNMFGQASPDQRAGMLNELLRSAGPAVLGAGAAGGLGGILGQIFGGGQGQAGQQNLPQVTPEQAQQVRPEDVERIAAHAREQSPDVMDKLGRFYADHPDLVKGLGLVAITVAMNKMREGLQRRG